MSTQHHTASKYYAPQFDRAIDLETDGCTFPDWKQSRGKALFAKHADGFLVFLPPELLELSDEYKDSDPYSAAEKSSFHKRRMECTLELTRDAVHLLGRTPRILDLGCGQGHITQEIHRTWPEADVSGLDYSISAIKYANKHFPGIHFVVGNAYECPYAQGYFDLVICNNLWEHVPDPLQLLKQIARVLSPQGLVIISTPSRYRWGNLVNVLRGKPVAFMSEHHVTEYSVGQVIEQLRYGGFSVLKRFSRPLGSESLSFKVARGLFSIFASLTGSHHELESTIFYLAQQGQPFTRVQANS